jgi:hypothetical protein
MKRRIMKNTKEKRVKEPKKIANFTCVESTHDVFEEFWLYLRSQVKSTFITKSVLIEQMILLTANDIKKNGIKSELYKELSKLKEIGTI